jgi:branched-chain amino acid transport system substrate-binding protein
VALQLNFLFASVAGLRSVDPKEKYSVYGYRSRDFIAPHEEGITPMHRVIPILAAAALALLSGCSGGTSKVVIVGAVLPMTGSAAQWGGPARDAVLMAQEEINAAGGINGDSLKVVFEDDRCEAATGVSAMQHLIATVHPVAVIGAVCSSVTLAIAPVAEQNRIVLLSPASTNPAITNAGDYIFRDVPSDALRGQVFSKYVSSLGIDSVSILYINNDGGLGNEQTFAENFKKLGGTVVSTETYAQDARDMRSQLTKIKSRKTRALVVVSYPDDTPIILRQVKELGIHVPLYFQTEALDDPAVIRNAGGAAEGATYILPAAAEGRVPQDFASNYRKRYGREPEQFAAEAYDATELIAKLLRAASRVSSDALKTGLYATKDYSGASGVLSFDSNGDVSKPMVIKRIQAGQRQVVARQ